MSERKDRKQWSIEVTDEDIEKAHKNDSYKCVVAQAVARQVKDATRVEVDVASIRFTRMGQRYIYPTPYTVQGYVVAFDAGDDIQPFSFKLTSPSISARRPKSEAGKAQMREYSRKRAGKPSDPEDVKLVAEAKKEGKPRFPQTGGQKGRKRPAPTVAKGRMRTYGHRALRVNAV